MKFFKKLRRNEEGATAIEYGLIAALIAVAAISAMGAVGNQVFSAFDDVNQGLGGDSVGEAPNSSN